MYVLKTQNSANLKNILEEMVPNINLLITFVRRRYAVVFLRSLPSQTMLERLNAYLLRYFLAAQYAHQ